MPKRWRRPRGPSGAIRRRLGGRLSCAVVGAGLAVAAVQSPAVGQEAPRPPGAGARLTVGVPALVWHPKPRPGPEPWNEGWFRNEGVLVDLTWPVLSLRPNINLRLGLAAGGFDNSVFRSSVFLGAAAELEAFASPRLAFSLGAYAGGVTGYWAQVVPAGVLYLGTSYALTDRLELGLRGFWLPAETVVGPALAPSDALIGAITIGTRF